MIVRQSVRVRRSFQRLGGPLCCLCSGIPFRFVNYRLSRKVTADTWDIMGNHGTRKYHGICPGILKDLYHTFMSPLVGPNNVELANVASSYYRKLEDEHKQKDGIWDEVGHLLFDDLSDPDMIRKDEIKDFMEDDDEEFLKLLEDDGNGNKSRPEFA